MSPWPAVLDPKLLTLPVRSWADDVTRHIQYPYLMPSSTMQKGGHARSAAYFPM